jgi:acetyl-CoA/propionyl-CoA carboxylase biotin carboxyl carrier protein
VVADPAFAPADPAQPFAVHTRWIETEFANTIPPWNGPAGEGPDDAPRETLVVEVGGKRLAVSLPAGLGAGGLGGGGLGGGGLGGGGLGGGGLGGGGLGSSGLGSVGGAAVARQAPRRTARTRAGAAVSGAALTSPMQGTIVKIAVTEGQAVSAGDLVVVLEAMKMEQPITAHRAGTVTGLAASVGQTVTSGAVLCELKD